jgi:ABC-2 type transport system ATP-binding protein
VPADRALALARVGAIVEEPRFHKHLTGRENLAVIAAARGDAAHARIEGALERVGLTERADDRVGKYSLGMRQRLGIGRCLLADPELLILDEPTNGLDPAGITEFRGMIRRFVAEGRTVLLSSHLLDEVERICDAAAIVDRGRVVQQGTIAEISAGAEQTLVVRCDQRERAAELIRAHSDTGAVEDTPDGLQVTLRRRGDAAEATAADLNRRLVEAGITVHRLELARASLESRFLEITSRLGVAA